MKQSKAVTFFSLFFLCCFLIMTGCIPPGGRGRTRLPPPPPPPQVIHAPEKKEPPAWAPAHGHREKRMHRYHYYPDAQVYFDTGRGLYFYMERGSWAMAATLPPFIHIDARKYYMLEYDDDRPYVHHHETVKKYPPGRMEKKHKGHKEKEKKRKGHGNKRDW